MEQGVLTYLKETDYTMAGRKVELVTADTGGAPAGAKTKAQELIERDKVDVILGPLAAFELLAITDYIREQKTPLLSLAAADDMSQRRPNPYFLRASATSSQAMHPMGHYAATELKLKRIVTISEDLAFGYEQMGGFQSAFEADGGCIVNKLWPPLVTPDYTPYIAQIADCDGVCQGFAGSNPLRFMKAYADAGMKFPVVTGWTGGDDALLHSFGNEAIGLISCSAYSLDLDTERNHRFIDGMAKNFNNVPGFYAAGLYINCQVVEAALKAVGGEAGDKDKLMAALRAVQLTDTPRGPLKFDHLGNVVGNFYVRRCGARFLELAQRQARLGERGAVGDRVDDRQFVLAFAVQALGIERGDDAAAGAAHAGRAKPSRNDLDHDIGERADPRKEQDDEAPGHEAPGARGVDDQRDVNSGDDPTERYAKQAAHSQATASRPGCDLAIAEAF